MNNILLVLIGGLILIGGLFAYNGSQKEDAMMKDASDDMMPRGEEMETKEMNKEVMIDAEGDLMMKSGTYEAYSPEKLQMAEAGKVVLFFKASWCPTCRALDADLKAHLSEIPEGVTVLEVNYDASTELKKKYGVTSQHTLVQVDAQGGQITKWSGGLTLATIVQNLK